MWSPSGSACPGSTPTTLHTDGTLGDRADLNANFRDEYYALVPAVDDDADGPPLVTSGLIDPGACLWGRRRVRFAKRHFEHPRVDLDRLDGRFPAWAKRKLVPKVLIANQTRIIEAVADPDGRWLPGVPVTTATPTASADVWEICAVLTSPVAAIGAWHHGAGTGLSTTSVRVGPVSLASTPWPAGPLTDAVAGLRDGDVERCARSVLAAYDLEPSAADPLISWWSRDFPAAPTEPEHSLHTVPAGRPGDHPEQHHADEFDDVHHLGHRRTIAADHVEERAGEHRSEQCAHERQHPEGAMRAPGHVQQSDTERERRRADVTGDVGGCAVDLAEHER